MRLDVDLHAVAVEVRHEREADRAVVHEERVGEHVVGSQRLAVEVAGAAVGGVEIAPVEHQVSADLAQALAAQRAQQHPEALVVQARIALALEHEVARQHPVAQLARRVGLGLPAIRGPEELERGQRREELHRGGGVHRRVGVHAQRGPGRPDFLHDDRDRTGGNFRRPQRGRDLGRQPGGGQARLRRKESEGEADRQGIQAGHARILEGRGSRPPGRNQPVGPLEFPRGRNYH